MRPWLRPLVGVGAGVLALGLVFVTLFVSGAQAAPKVGTRISVVACPYAGVTASCLMIKGGDGTIYNITGMSPKPRQGKHMIWLRGTVTDKVSMCNEGIVLSRIRWTQTRQKCAN